MKRPRGKKSHEASQHSFTGQKRVKCPCGELLGSSEQPDSSTWRWARRTTAPADACTRPSTHVPCVLPAHPTPSKRRRRGFRPTVLGPRPSHKQNRRRQRTYGFYAIAVVLEPFAAPAVCLSTW